MSLSIETYYRITEKKERISGLYDNHGDNAIFIVPAALDKELILKLISKDGSFFGPRPKIWTLGEMYRELVPEKEQRRVIDPPDHHLIIRYIRDEYLEEANAALPPGVKHDGFIKLLGDNIRELLLEGVSPEYFSNAILDEAAPESITPESILGRLYSRYMRYLSEHKLADNAQIPTLISDMLETESIDKDIAKRKLIFVGFLTFTGAQLKLVKKLGAAADCMFILPYSGLDGFHDAISQLGVDFKNLPDFSISLARLLGCNRRLEFNALARELALWMSGISDLVKLGKLGNYGEIAIQVQPESLSLLENSFARYKIPFSLQVRGSVAETLLGTLPRAAWNAYSLRWATNETVSLLANPLLGCADFKTVKALEAFPEGADAWTDYLKESPQTLKVFKKIIDFCDGLMQGGTPVEILKSWRDFINGDGGREILSLTAASIKDMTGLDVVIKDLSSSLTELDKKAELLDDLNHDIGEAAKVEYRGAEAIRYILDWSDTATLPIQLPQSGAVTVYAGTPPTLTTHKYWIMTDVDYNTWPGKLRESPLLSNEYKNKLNGAKSDPADGEDEECPHIPVIRERREQKEALFRRLLATGTEGVIITRALTDTNNRPIGDSQFVASLPKKLIRKDFSIKYSLADSMPGSHLVSEFTHNDLWFPEAELYYGIPKTRSAFPKVVICEAQKDEALTVSLSTLDDWVSCPYRYWCKNTMHLEERATGLFNSKRAGTGTHEVWELAWKDYIEKPRSFVILTRAHWEEAFKKRYEELLTDKRLKRRLETLQKQVENLAELQDEIESRVADRHSVSLEYSLPEYDIDGVSFKGKADRIDYYKDGFVILDYKSNNASDHKNELQLAAYSHLLASSTGSRPLGYAWFGHKDSRLYGNFEDKTLASVYGAGKQKPNKTLKESVELAGTKMAEMAAALRMGEYPANYSADSCRYCSFYTLCRKRNTPRYELEDGDAVENGGGEDFE